MSDSIEIQNAVSTLNQLRKKVESSWTDIASASDDYDKRLARSRYRQIYRTYKQKLLMVDPKARDEHQHQHFGKQPVVFSYTDYRLYLSDLFRYQEIQDPNWARKLEKSGIQYSSLLDLLERDHDTELSELEPLRGLLQLGDEEWAFLKLLVKMDQATTKSELIQIIEQVFKNSLFAAHNPSLRDSWRYLAHWYVVAIKELAAIEGFKAKAEWIQPRLRRNVPLEKIDETLKFLIETGLIEIDENENAKAVDKRIRCEGGFFSLALANFHKEMLAMTAAVLDTTNSEERYIIGQTGAFSKEGLVEIKQILQEAHAKILKVKEGNQQGDQVYHIGLFAAPLTKSDGFD